MAALAVIFAVWAMVLSIIAASTPATGAQITLVGISALFVGCSVLAASGSRR